SYTQMAEAAASWAADGFAPVDGILLDLGLSSLQLDDRQRGFAFQAEGPLDMRFDPTSGPSAAEIVNTWPIDELADIIFRYGEDRNGNRIARAIGEARPLSTTVELEAVIDRAVGGRRGER